MTYATVALVSGLVGATAGILVMAIFISGDYADLGLTKQALLSDIDYLLDNTEDKKHIKVLLRMKKYIEEELI